MHACVQSRQCFQPSCPQVCSGAASLLRAPEDRDFHGQRPADGMYMCQPLQQIRNPLQPWMNVPLQFCNLQDEGKAVTYLQFPAEPLEPLQQC